MNNMEEMEARLEMERQMSGMERCPLSSAAKALANVDGAVMIVIGTEECCYYTKSGLTRRGNGDSCFSLVMDKHDVTFGSSEKVADAIDELLTDMTPKMLFLITTCVPEIIGEDYYAVAQEAQDKYNLPVHVLSTNHYSGKDGEYGFELVEKALGYSLPRRKKGDGNKHHGKRGPDMGHKGKGDGHHRSPENGGSDMGHKGKGHGGRHGGGADMSEAEMMEMMRKKMGDHLTDEEIRAKIQSHMGGGEHR